LPVEVAHGSIPHPMIPADEETVRHLAMRARGTDPRQQKEGDRPKGRDG
jgi:hypothetical protein